MLATPAALGHEAFPYGVAVGDVADNSAIFWTWAAGTTVGVRLEIATDEDFASIVVTRGVLPSADDPTFKAEVTGLAPHTTYHYRFVITDGDESAGGHFRTAPAADDPAAVRFIFSGDTNFAVAPFGVMSHVPDEDADAFFWFGDTLYADVPAGGQGVAVTLEDYRGRYQQIRSDPNVRAALAATALWVGGDDHEVTNDYAGEDPTLPKEQLNAGFRAFFEYMPIRDQAIAFDPFRTYRRQRYGANVELFILDGRQYRAASAQQECDSNLDPDGLLLGPLSRDDACRAALRGPERSMLGHEQLEWLKAGLLESDAPVKLVLNNVPLSYLGVYPYDRWDGYDAERRELLEFIHANRIAGVTILTTDIHANAYNPDVSRYFRRSGGYRLDGGVAIPEIIAGPLGNHTLHQSATSGGGGVLGPVGGPLASFLEGALVARLRCLDGFEFVETNRVSYAVIDVSQAGELRVTYRGALPKSAKDPGAPLETFFESTVGSQPAPLPCALPLLAMALCAALRAIRPGRLSRPTAP